jgi:alpha-beta hydrolase superfamily lysophospholipase
MNRKVFRVVKYASACLLIALAVFLGLRVVVSLRGPSLSAWHTYVPREMTVAQMQDADWTRYLAEEARVFMDVRTEVTQRLAPDERVPSNRYFAGSPLHPGRFAQDFNRSYVLEPAGAPVGVAVLLHGLTDSPYSQRHIARLYRDRGFVAVVPRLLAHGTVPGALTDVAWEDWMAATRLAVREARRRVAAPLPLHIVGYSNGGALAVKYALDALADERMPQADRIVLLSPMIGVTRFARFAGLAGLPAVLPAFAQSAWLGIVPEFNPFKYNSFPVNGARQSHRLSQALQDQIQRYAGSGAIARIPPILTFQSVMDFTVSTPALVSSLYDQLPANGSELVLFDVNRAVRFESLMRESARVEITRLLPARIRSYRVAVIGNANEQASEVVVRTIDAGTLAQDTTPLPDPYPRDIYSLSHIAVPFPANDSLYGFAPETTEFGVNLGAVAPRGERGILITDLDFLLRLSANPFFPYMAERITHGIVQPVPPKSAATMAPIPVGGEDRSVWRRMREVIAVPSINSSSEFGDQSAAPP